MFKEKIVYVVFFLAMLGTLKSYDATDIDRLIKVTSEKNLEKKNEEFVKFLKYWEENTNSKIIINADKLFKLCIGKINKFQWAKYETLTTDEYKKLAIGDKNKIKEMAFYFEALAIGVAAGNPVATKFYKLLSKKDKSTKFETDFYDNFSHSVKNYSREISSSKYMEIMAGDNAIILLKGILDNKKYLTDDLAAQYLFLVSNMNDIITKQKDFASKKTEIMKIIERQLDDLPQDPANLRSENWKFQEIFIRLHKQFSSENEHILWLKGIVKADKLNARIKEKLLLEIQVFEN